MNLPLIGFQFGFPEIQKFYEKKKFKNKSGSKTGRWVYNNTVLCHRQVILHTYMYTYFITTSPRRIFRGNDTLHVHVVHRSKASHLISIVIYYRYDHDICVFIKLVYLLGRMIEVCLFVFCQILMMSLKPSYVNSRLQFSLPKILSLRV